MEKIELIKKQHSELAEIVTDLKKSVAKEDYISASKIISQLSGKLSIHLRYEDEHIYPELIQSNNDVVKNTANKFIKEMGNLALVFNEYKNKYNTRSKIVANEEEFKKSSLIIINALEKRLNKEDKELYIHL